MIVLGKKGSKIKIIGTNSRKKIEKMYDKKTGSEKLENVLNAYIEKHYSLWQNLKSKKICLK